MPLLRTISIMIMGLVLLPLQVMAGSAPAPEGEGDSLGVLLILLSFVGIAYLLAHFVVDRLQRRFLFVSGLEYVLLGIVLGPELDLLTGQLDKLAPVIAFAAGWIGLLYGMDLKLPGLRRGSAPTPDDAGGNAPTPDETKRSVRLSLVEALLTGIGVGGCSWAFFSLDPFQQQISSDQAMLCAAFLGCGATAGSSSAVDLLCSRYRHLETQLLPLLRRTARLGDILAILGFGLILCIFHEVPADAPMVFGHAPVPSTWVLLTGGLGLALGGLFWVFLGDDDSDNSRFLALVGIISFASGAAFFLDLSVLTVNLLLGVVLVNTRHGQAIQPTLAGTHKPVSLILLVFAGVLWTPVDILPGLLVCVGFIGLRLVFKAIGCWAGALGTRMRGDLVRGLLAQGHVALAIGLMFRLIFSGPAVDLAYTALLASVCFYELIGPRALKGLLIDAGDLRQDVRFLQVQGQ